MNETIWWHKETLSNMQDCLKEREERLSVENIEVVREGAALALYEEQIRRAIAEKREKFDRKTYRERRLFGFQDQERLHATSIESFVITEVIDSIPKDKKATDDLLSCITFPILVKEMRPLEIDERWFKQVSARLLVSLFEEFDEEFGDPESDEYPAITPNEEGMILETIKEIVSNYYVWACETVQEHKLTEDDVRRIIQGGVSND